MRPVFCVSDHTGLTAETIARSLLTRFPEASVTYEIRPFVDTPEKIASVVAEIDASVAGSRRPIVFSTISDPALSAVLAGTRGLVIGLFDTFVERLAAELGLAPSETVGAFHGMRDTAKYQVRLDAVDFALSTDDGLGVELYGDAEIILVGVSRVGKTPTSLYLAMQYGIRAANYPVTPDEPVIAGELPAPLAARRDRLYGLTIDPVRLYQIRQKRRPDSEYSSLEQCGREVMATERLLKAHRVPVIDTTARSIEEIAATIISEGGLERRLD